MKSTSMGDLMAGALDCFEQVTVETVVAADRAQQKKLNREARKEQPRISVWDIHPSPENAKIYRDRTSKDSDFARIIESIRKDGVLAPLLISLDKFVISGHQRLAGAIEAGKDTVPYIVLNLRRSDHTSDEWLAILREHNTGREKTFDELVREKLIDIDPQQAARNLAADRIKRTRSRMPTVELGSQKKRSKISPMKRPFADRIIEILKDLEEYLPVSVRAVHYRLLNKPLLRNTKEKTRYKNDLESYKDLSNMLTRMRISGEVPFESICDETRTSTTWRCSLNASEFIAKQVERLFKGYFRDLLQSQSVHFEVVVEKLTVKNFIEPIAARYRMPVVIMRGNSGIDARFKISKRFKASSKSKLVCICLGDCDPDGDSIVESTVRSMRDDFEIDTVEGVRVAMTHAQADALGLPKNIKADEKESSNLPKFLAAHGRDDCYELEAVEPDVLQGWLDEAIRSVIDVEAFNHESEKENAEAAEIQAQQEAVREFLKTRK